MFSRYHLDYLTLAPGLHLFFSPQRLMRVVNGLLDRRFQHINAPRNHPGRSYRGDRDVLPMLNGMGFNDFEENASMFTFDLLDQVSIARHFMGERSLPARLVEPLIKLPPFISEVFTFHVCAVMRPGKAKPQGAH